MRPAAFALILCFAIAAQAGEREWPREFNGQAKLKDADSLYVQGRELRLAGIDAPEWSQPCRLNGEEWFAGRAARDAVAALIGGRRLHCVGTGEQTYGRAVARCYLDGRDLQEIIVAAGWAFDYRQYSKGRYAQAEAEARRARRGLWQGVCEKPWVWRRKNR